MFCVFFISFIEFSFNFQYLHSEPALVRDFTKVGIYKLKLFILRRIRIRHRHVWYFRHHFLEYKHSTSMLALVQRKLPAITLLLINNKRIQLGQASLNLIDLFLKWGGDLHFAGKHLCLKSWIPPPAQFKNKSVLSTTRTEVLLFCIYLMKCNARYAICMHAN